MRISFLISNLSSGGAERTVAYLANYFVRKGINADVLMYGTKHTVFYKLEEGVRVVSLCKEGNVNGFVQRIKKIFERIRNYKKYVKQNKPDIVFSICGNMFYTLFARKGYALIASERSCPEAETDKKTIFLRKFYAKRVDGYVFQTKRAKEYYNNNVGGPEGVVIQNAIGNLLVYNTKTPEYRENKIVAMGRLVPVKDYETMLKAFKKVHEKHAEFILEIYGEGPLLNNLQKIAQDLGIKDSVKFMGAREDAIYKINSAKCFVLSSVYEGMPNALLEAMAIGLPCVSTDCPNGPSELIQNGINGQLVRVGDYEAMADAINKYIEYPEFAEKCSAEAKKVKETNDINTICEQYLAYAKSLIK